MRMMMFVVVFTPILLAVAWCPWAPKTVFIPPSPSATTHGYWQTTYLPKPTPIRDQSAAIARATRAAADVNALNNDAILYQPLTTLKIGGTPHGLVLSTPEGWWLSVNHAGEFHAGSNDPMAMPFTDRTADPRLTADVLNRLAVIEPSLREFAWVSSEPTLTVTAHPTVDGGWSVYGWQRKSEFGGNGWSMRISPDGTINGGIFSFRGCGGHRLRKHSVEWEPTLPVGSG